MKTVDLASPTRLSAWSLQWFTALFKSVLCLACLATGLRLLFLPLASASSFFPRPFPQTVQEAPVILKGKIGSHYADWGKGDDSKKIYTYYEMQTEEVLKGQPLSDPSRITVRELGGEKNGVGLQVDGAAQFETGETVVVFLKDANSEGTFDVHGMMLGKLNLEKTPNGEEILSGPALVKNSSSAKELPDLKKWTITDLKRIIREQAQDALNRNASKTQSSQILPHSPNEAPSPSPRSSTTPVVGPSVQPHSATVYSTLGFLLALVSALLGIIFFLRRTLT